MSYLKGRTQSVIIKGAQSSGKTLLRGFPQGSVLGPDMYPLCTSPLFEIAEKYKVNKHMYADDTQLYLASDRDSIGVAVNQLQLALKEIKEWKSENHLKLNDDKTEFVIIGKKSLLKNVQNVNIKLGRSIIPNAKSAKNIGAILDTEMSMEDHIAKVVRACFMQLRRIAHVRQYLSKEATEILVNSSVTSRLDYINSLFYGIPSCLLKKLQNIQNSAARIILRKKKFDHVTPLLKQLHWLPVEVRIKFKINLLTYKALNGMAPRYLELLVTSYHPSRSLRSSSQLLLKEKRARNKNYGDRAFSVYAPKLWNALPLPLRTCVSACDFKAALKTYYFRLYLTLIYFT